jgi:hypothetical protein
VSALTDEWENTKAAFFQDSAEDDEQDIATANYYWAQGVEDAMRVLFKMVMDGIEPVDAASAIFDEAGKIMESI